MNLIFYSIKDDKKSFDLLSKVKSLPNVEVENIFCPPLMSEWYHMPFMRDEKGYCHCGTAGIDFFIRKNFSDKEPYYADNKSGENQ
ncbi:MAG: hypothetical protein AABY32_00705 [Nanoarchaeota archaeon]